LLSEIAAQSFTKYYTPSSGFLRPLEIAVAMEKPPGCVSIHLVATGDVIHHFNRVVGGCYHVVFVGHVLLPLVLLLHSLSALRDSILDSCNVVGIKHINFITEDKR